MKLDIEKLKLRANGITTTQEALKDVAPINWSQDVLDGKKKVVVKEAHGEKDGCVKLEISYL